MTPAAALLALQHADSAFPGGGFAFSGGLEGLGALGDAKPSAAEVARFVREGVRLRWASADRVALVLAFRAGEDIGRLCGIDRDFERSTFCRTLREGSRRNGRALLSTHARLGTPGAAALEAAIGDGRAAGTLPAVQGHVWRGLGLGEETAALMAGYQLVAGSLAAAVRLGLVGAIGAQALAAPLLAAVAEAAGEPVADDAEIAGFAPFSEIAAMRQARLATRLFSN